VKLVGSVLDAGAATADTTGGSGGTPGGQGRLILGSNTPGGGPTVVGGTTSTFVGIRGDNPFVSGTDDTPYIPDLVGGADMFGLLDGIDANNPAFAALFGSAPSSAVGALLRVDVGPIGYDDDYFGFDMLLMLNLTGDDLLDPLLGVDPTGTDPAFVQSLLAGGFGTQSLFGGTGPTPLGMLGGFDIYATLTPEGSSIFNASVQGARSLNGIPLANGDIAYLQRRNPTAIPVPATFALLLLGLGALALGSRVRRPGSQPS
ncbi:hypothetical protein CKO28_26055, partial [Rhodovibrio sodomensis]|nr:hypothetical protein [Rhodovibrio sodomensis]